MSSQPPETPEPLIGQVLDGRYRILERIAEGAMGIVYLAERTKLRRRVAVKFLRASFAVDDRFRSRFEREARAMSRLSHPHCVSVIDFGLVDDGPYIVMDRVIGTDLQALLEHGPLPAVRAVHIARQMLAGLAHAHGQGIIHRDIKPGNVMLTEATGTGDHVRLLDFGLAKLREPGSGDVSAASVVVGTPSYMSPEQSMGEKVDARTDIYSTGVVLYELLTGIKPFTADETYETLRRHREEAPPPMKKVAPEITIPAGLEEVVRKALAKDRDERYQTPIEFADALKAVMDDELARAPTVMAGDRVATTAAVQRGGPRRGLSTLLLFVMVAGAAAGGWYVWRQIRRAGHKAPRSAAPAPVPTVDHPTPDLGEMPGVIIAGNDAAPADAPVADAMPGDAAATDASWDADDEPPDVADDGGVDDGDAGPDEAADEPPDNAEAEPEPAPAPLPVTLDSAKKLIADGKREQAISMLRTLRKKRPKSAHIPYLLGNLYFDKGWWVAGIESYDASIKNNRGYRVNPTLINNVIRALASHKRSTRSKVYTLFQKRIGRSGVSRLKHAAAKDHNPNVRSRARWLLKKMHRR